MAHIERSALLPYSAEQMFELVNDIAEYPSFMQGCVEAEVLEQSDDELVGRLTLAKAGIRQQFTTRNKLQRPVSLTRGEATDESRPGSIDMSLVEGDFQSFAARWDFKPLGESACKVGLSMDFEFRAGFIDRALQLFFQSSANSQVDAIVARAHEVYGS